VPAFPVPRRQAHSPDSPNLRRNSCFRERKCRFLWASKSQVARGVLVTVQACASGENQSIPDLVVPIAYVPSEAAVFLRA
jgi:hypothetical protein